MCSLYSLFLCALSKCSFNVLFVFAHFMRSFNVPCLCAFLMRSLYSLFLCALFICCFYALFVFPLVMCYFNVLFLCALFMRSLYSLFSCALFMCSFYALFVFAFFMRYFHMLAILRMHRKYYCIQTNMTDDKMDDVLKKLGLSDHRTTSFEEKMSTDIVCYLSIEDFLKLGLTDCNAIMSLKNECSTFAPFLVTRLV